MGTQETFTAWRNIEPGQLWRDELNRFYRVVAVTDARTVFVKPAHLKHTQSWIEAKPEDGGWTFVR